MIQGEDITPCGDHDVIVVGGGVSGSMAAIAAARLGADTLLIEQHGFLGGALTAMGVSPMMTFHAGDLQVVRGLPQEVVQHLVDRAASPGHIVDTVGFASSVTPFDTEAMKAVLEEMAVEAGVELLYHSTLVAADSNRAGIESPAPDLGAGLSSPTLLRVCVANRSGLQSFRASVFVDATGDADLAAKAGVPTVTGRESDSLTQPMTMNFRVGNVDIPRIRQCIRDNPNDFNLKDAKLVMTAPRLSVSGFFSEVRAAKDAGELTIARDMALFFETNTPGEVNVNMTRLHGYDATNARSLTEAEVEGRRQVTEVFRFLKKWVPGFGGATLLTSGPHIGVRESRRIVGLYTLTADDLLNDHFFEDVVARGGYPIDIHSPTGEGIESRQLQPGASYGIPFRCLLNATASNLLVAGRCLSATHEALAAVRVSPIAMATGQAAGTAAALAASRQQLPGELPIHDLQATLREGGAFLGTP